MMQPSLPLLRLVAELLSESPHLAVWFEIERAGAVQALARTTTHDAQAGTFTTSTGKVFFDLGRSLEACRADIRREMLRQEVFEEIVSAAMGGNAA